MFGILARSGYRFNLSILECKCLGFSFLAFEIMRFNLSILECKYSTLVFKESIRAVLIYPYWNVNMKGHRFIRDLMTVLIYPYWNVNYSCATAAANSSSFNLSILECKSVTREQFQKYVCVLIYPYWNVNKKSYRDRLLPHGVLIYPYWNVNFDFPQLSFQIPGFNLSILECKYFHQHDIRAHSWF